MVPEALRAMDREADFLEPEERLADAGFEVLLVFLGLIPDVLKVSRHALRGPEVPAFLRERVLKKD